MAKRSFLISMALGLLAIAFGGATPGLAQDDEPPPVEPQIITLTQAADINGGSSSPAYLAVYNGGLYFRAEGNDGAGMELWKYHPTSGASRAADIFPGADSSNPAYLAVYNGALYFQANGNDGAGSELWKYDGTSASRVADIYPGAGDSIPASLAVYIGALYFSANGNDGAGSELWKYDGTSASRVADIYPGAGDSIPASLAVYSGALYFSANGNDGAGRELWKYDPTDGAQRVEDIFPGGGSSDPQYLTVYNDVLYFSADGNDGAGIEVWSYDPTDGVQRVTDFSAGTTGTFPEFLAVYHGALYFRALGNDGTWLELWKYDPINGVQRVTDFWNDVPGTTPPISLTVYKDGLYFGASGSNGEGGWELWMYDNSTVIPFRSQKGYDGWVLESGENTSVGGTLNNSATTFNLGDNAQNRQYRSLLSFNTASLPDTAVIVSVSLRLRYQGTVGTNPFTTHGPLRVDVRNGAFGGNIALQALDFQAAASQGNIGTIPNAPVGGWYSKTWTSGILTYINKVGVTQIRLRFNLDDNNDLGADYLKFFSSDATTISHRPLLEVRYYLP
jgi:ELWxxDGT repeat protein